MWKRGMLVSPCPPVRPPVLPSVDGIVHSIWECPLCTLHNIRWIHLIFLHLIKQLQKVYRILCFFLAKFQNLHFWQFVLNLLLWLVSFFVLFSFGMKWNRYKLIVCVIILAAGFSHNAGVLVALVSYWQPLSRPLPSVVLHILVNRDFFS